MPPTTFVSVGKEISFLIVKLDIVSPDAGIKTIARERG